MPLETHICQETCLSLWLHHVEAAADTAPTASSNQVIRTIRGLRTIHGNFLDKPVPEAAPQTILQATVRAANASNNQSLLDYRDQRSRHDGPCPRALNSGCARIGGRGGRTPQGVRQNEFLGWRRGWAVRRNQRPTRGDGGVVSQNRSELKIIPVLTTWPISGVLGKWPGAAASDNGGYHSRRRSLPRRDCHVQ